MSGMENDGRTRWSESVYRLLLFLYPADFRLEYGPGMVEAFRDRWVTEQTKTPRWVALRVWLFAIRDLFSTAVEERTAQWRTRSSGNHHPEHPEPRSRIELLHDIWRDMRHALRGLR